MRKGKRNKKKKTVLILAIIVLLLLFGVSYYFFVYRNDELLLDRLDKQIDETNELITKDETVDTDVTDQIGSDVSESDNDLDELDASFDSILNDIENIEKVESQTSSDIG